VTEVSLPPLHELELAPRRKGFRIAPRSWPGPADATCPEFRIGAADLWSVWMEFAARQPRLVLRARDAHASRSLHVQRSAVLRFPDLVRAEIVALGAERSSLVLDSRARFGCWDFGVNRRRVLRWLHYLKQFMPHDSAKWSMNVAGLTALKRSLFFTHREETEAAVPKLSSDVHINLCDL
jgi:hypothetical protein